VLDPSLSSRAAPDPRATTSSGASSSATSCSSTCSASSSSGCSSGSPLIRGSRRSPQYPLRPRRAHHGRVSGAAANDRGRSALTLLG